MVGERDREADGPAVRWELGEPPPSDEQINNNGGSGGGGQPTIKEVRYAPFPPPQTPPLPPPLPLQIQQQRPYSRYLKTCQSTPFDFFT